MSGKRRQTFNPSLASTVCSVKLQLSLKPGKVTLSMLPSSVLQLWVAQRSHCFANPTAWNWDSSKISQAHEWVVLQTLQGWCLRLAFPACIVLPAPPGHPREGSKCRKGHSVSSRVPFPGLTQSPAIDTEHKHVCCYVSQSVFSLVSSNTTNNKCISSFISTSITA